MTAGAEDIEQIKVVNWVKQCTDIPILAIANQRKCTMQYGAFLKKMGVTAGVCDLFLPRGNSSFSGLWVEMKIKPNYATEKQKSFMASMIKEGYSAHVAYSADEAILIIKSFYSIE